jgi:trehalose utilization protein
VYSDFLNADLQKVFANEIKWVQACIDARGCHFQHLLLVHSDFPNADLQKVFVNKIKWVQACIDVPGCHFQHLL